MSASYRQHVPCQQISSRYLLFAPWHNISFVNRRFALIALSQPNPNAHDVINVEMAGVGPAVVRRK
jgi:hypothetical protein